MSSRAASGRKKLAKAASKDAKNTPAPPTRHSGNSLPSPPIKQSTFVVANPSPSVSNTFDPLLSSGSRSPSAHHDRPASPTINADESRLRSPLKMFSGRSSGSTSLPQSPLRMESSLSPSVDQALQTRGPNATAHGVQPPRHSPLPPSSPRSASLSTLDEHSTSQSGSSSSGSFASSHSSPSSLRANAPSSTFSSSSGSTESQTSPKAFVFPSSRSRAHPNLTASGKVPKLKLKSKKNKGKEAQRTSSPSTTSGSSGVTVHNLHPPTSSPEPAVRPRNSSVNSTSPTRRTSSDISSGFVFPSSRSRAHPSGPPSKLRLPLTKKKSKSSSTGSSSAAQVALSEGEPSRSRFMGIPINKKKKLADPVFHTSVDFGGADAYSPMRRSFDDVSLIGSGFGPYEESIRSSWTPTPFATKRDVYPLDPYDGVLVEQDRLTTSLLRRLNSCDSPSFHHYGTNPPVSVLDLGCGQGDWVLDAAATWKGYGTRVTGFDMVDITRSLRSAAVKHGVLDSIQFVRGNFLQEALPFPDESFDLVRMASLTYAISFEKWEFVLKEACRVLTVGGRLEMIDDHIFFPYGRAPQAPHPHDTIPEEGGDDSSDSPILSGARRSARHPTPSTSTSVVPVDFEADQWTDQAGAARELESLFEHMHNMKFGIHLCPTQFIVDMMEQVLGHANEIRTMHLTLAPPHPGFEATGKEGHSAAPTDEGTHPLLNAPGLMLWPSTFVPMTGPEIEVHALKHPRVLLSLKNSLAEYALEIADEEEVDEAAVKESLWEYEGFLRERFNPPQFIHESAPTLVSPRPASSHDPASTWHSRHGSQGSVSSVSSEGRDALQEYQIQLRDHILWDTDSGSDESVPPTPRQCGTPTQEFEIPDDASSTAHSIASLPSFSTSRQSFMTNATSMHVPPPPDYSKYEQTHIRTFHVFEAIKMDETLLGAAI